MLHLVYRNSTRSQLLGKLVTSTPSHLISPHLYLTATTFLWQPVYVCGLLLRYRSVQGASLVSFRCVFLTTLSKLEEDGQCRSDPLNTACQVSWLAEEIHHVLTHNRQNSNGRVAEDEEAALKWLRQEEVTAIPGPWVGTSVLVPLLYRFIFKTSTSTTGFLIKTPKTSFLEGKKYRRNI